MEGEGQEPSPSLPFTLKQTGPEPQGRDITEI
jgi:hypothetical protein